MKALKRMISILLCFALGITPFLTACNNGAEQVTISFYEDSVAAEPFSTMQADKGSVPNLSSVTPPERTGESFVGWTDTKNSQVLYDASKSVDADLSLYGVWKIDANSLVRITFYPNYEGANAMTQSGKKGAAIEFPTVEREHYTFDGWYLDQKCETPYDSLNYPDKDLSLYAKWKLNDDSVLVTYMLGDEVYKTAAATKGGKASEIACDPDNYVFVDWLGSNGLPFDFNQTINESTTIYADYYSKGLSVEDFGDGDVEVMGYDESYGPHIVIPAKWTDPENGEELTITSVGSLGGLNCETVVIKEGVERIESGAFSNCALLKKIVVPSSVTYIGRGAFSGCESLTEKQFPENDAFEIVDGLLLSDNGKTALLYVGDSDAALLTVPASVTKIERYAFSYANIAKVVIPTTVKTIESYAFADSLIGEAEINADVTALNTYAFSNSTLLRTVSLAANIVEIRNNAFNGCTGLTNVTVGAAKLKLGEKAFYYCSALESFPFDKVDEQGEGAFAFAGIKEYTFPQGTTEITSKQFENWQRLERVELPSSIKTIADSAFDGCEALAEVDFPADAELETIGERAFAGTKITELDLSGCTKLTSIGRNAFNNCSLLETVVLPGSLHAIGYAAFSGCSAMTELTIPYVGGYDYVGFQSQFEDDFMPQIFNTLSANSNFTVAPATYKTEYEADPDAFAEKYFVNGMKDVLVWYELHKGNDEDGYYAKNLEEVFSTAALFGYIFGSTSYSNSTQIMQYMQISSGGAPTTYSFYIPENLNKITITGKYVTAYGFNSMYNWQGEYVFTDALTAIGAYAFSLNTAMKSYNFAPATALKTIGSNAFQNNRALENVTFPDSLVEIGASAFRYCEALTTVKIPAGTTDSPLKLGAYAFADCEALNAFYSEGDQIEVGTYMFHNLDLSNYCFINCTQLKKIESRSSVGFVIDNYAAEGSALICNPFYTDSLVEVNFPTNIEDYRFTLPEGVTSEAAEQLGFIDDSLPSRLFTGCVNLAKFNAGTKNGVSYDVIIPDGTRSIGAYAFQAETSGLNSRIMPIHTIYFPDSMERLFEGVFGHTDLEVVDASMIEDIADGFDYADHMKKITLSDSTVLSTWAFTSARALETIAIKGADGQMLHDEEGVVHLPSATTTIPSNSFEYCALKKIVLHEGITTVGHYGFYGAEQLAEITLPVSLETIEDGAFANCYALKTVNFAKNGKLSFIDGNAFQYCTSLQKIEIPEGVTYIGSNAFAGSYRLESVTLPSTLYFLGGSGTFTNCLGLKEIFLNGSVPPQIEFAIGVRNAESVCYPTFQIVSEASIASMPPDLIQELHKLPASIIDNARTMKDNVDDFKNYFIGMNHLKIYIPEDAKPLYEENIGNNVSVACGTNGENSQALAYGWHNYTDALVTYEGGVYVESGSTETTAFYHTEDRAWFRLGSGELTEATVSGTTYTVNNTAYTYDDSTNTLTKGNTALKSIGGIYMDVTDVFSGGHVSGSDKSTRLMQFRPQLYIGANGMAMMSLYQAVDPTRKNATLTIYVPQLYFGSYELSWEGDALSVKVTFAKETTISVVNSVLNMNTADLSEATVITLTETGGKFASGTVVVPTLGEVVFTKGTVV